MNTKLNASLLAICCLFFASCSTFVAEKLLTIKRGVSVSEVIHADSDCQTATDIALKIPGLASNNARYSLLVSTMAGPDNDEFWIYVFKNGKLLYWGYPYQFLRNEDTEIRLAGEEGVRYMVSHNIMK